jgi:SAM-dependent methyltransferase
MSSANRDRTNGARPEYVTDVPYVRAFEHDLSPIRLRLAAVLNGLTPPPEGDFDYCELGSAHGDTTATLAAAYPQARFVGVDINPEHIASANALAAAGDLGNVRFLERDFDGLEHEDLPAFDFITAHGVLSWVGPLKRQALLRFAAAKLKPGGVLHVSYNALPGWAPLEPLRQLIVSRANLASGDSSERARQGVDFARRLNDLGAEYFESNPAARAMMTKLETLGMAYVAHEYLHAHWVPMYFAELAAEMAARDLFFVGQLPLYLNYRDLAIPQRLAPVFNDVGDRVSFESLKDFALNEYFRRDVFTKGRPARVDASLRAYLDETPFGSPLHGGGVPREAKLPHHTLHYSGPIFDVLLPFLEQGARTVRELASMPALATFGIERIRDSMLRLVLAEAVVPQRARSESTPAPEDALYRLPSAYNRGMLGKALSTESPITFASTVAGTGVEVSTVEAIAVYLLTEVRPAERHAWLEDRCGRATFRLKVRGRVIATHAEQVQVLLDELSSFSKQHLPKLVELGVLERRA